MLDKDRLILVIEVGLGNIPDGDDYLFLDKVEKSFVGRFDDSVIVIFVPRKDLNYVNVRQLNTDKVTLEELNAIIEKSKKIVEEIKDNNK